MKTTNVPDDAGTANTARVDKAERLVLYQTVAARRLAQDTMVWQVPGLALTAQAFLMTIGLGSGTGQLARIAAGLLSIVISIMGVQLLLRHRRNELADSVWLETFEQESGWPAVHGLQHHDGALEGKSVPWLGRFRSTRIWVAGLSVFGLVGLLVAIDALVKL